MNLKGLIPHRGRSGTDLTQLMNFQQEMNNLFEHMFSSAEVFPSFSLLNRFPYLNVTEKDKEIVVKIELPGIEEKDVTIETNQNQFIIRGEKKSELEEKEGTYHVRELSYGKFSRIVNLPFVIDSEKTKASFSKGVLTITVEKPAEQVSSNKKIPIENSDR